MPTSNSATPQDIRNYLDDMKAGLDAGPLGSLPLRDGVYRSQKRRKVPIPMRGVGATAIDPDGGRP
jgi:hypothetical protein